MVNDSYFQFDDDNMYTMYLTMKDEKETGYFVNCVNHFFIKTTYNIIEIK